MFGVGGVAFEHFGRAIPNSWAKIVPVFFQAGMVTVDSVSNLQIFVSSLR